jgi:hypothetical protein
MSSIAPPITTWVKEDLSRLSDAPSLGDEAGSVVLET